MKFIKISDIKPIVDFWADNIKQHLQKGERVSWIITGGSSMPIVVAICRQLENMNLENLSVTLSDERYGEPGHSDSNWEQLDKLGFFLPGANLQPVLNGKTLDETTKDYNHTMKLLLKDADYSIGLIGVGADGHIAGIKPGSPAVGSTDMTTSYKWDDYVRLSMTPAAVLLLDEVVTVVMGEAKHQTLKDLSKDLDINDQPAQILKKVASATVYNDLIGEYDEHKPTS